MNDKMIMFPYCVSKCMTKSIFNVDNCTYLMKKMRLYLQSNSSANTCKLFKEKACKYWKYRNTFSKWDEKRIIRYLFLKHYSICNFSRVIISKICINILFFWCLGNLFLYRRNVNFLRGRVAKIRIAKPVLEAQLCVGIKEYFRFNVRIFRGIWVLEI